MAVIEIAAEAVCGELQRVLGSTVFKRNDRLSGFLRFIVERRLEGRGQELKESVIAVEVFGREPDYNPKHDPIVRTEATRLRARLSQYYMDEGKASSLIIELPRGGYIPVFRQAETAQDAGPRVTHPRLWMLVAVASFAVAFAGWGWWRFQRQSTPIAIAVLPLINVSEDAANDYFADGLTGEIIRNLSIIEGVAVRSQTSSFVFKGKPRNVREAGRQFDAEYILEGSVLRAGKQLRITAQLVRVRDDLPVWSQRYDRELTDIFAIQDEISRGIVNGLRLKLGGGRRRYETSVEAYDFYLRARAFEMLPGFSGINRSVDPFEQALARDPSFAPAYAGLAAAHAARYGFERRINRADDLSKGWAAAQKAIQLDPLLAEAHDAMGMMHAIEAQWEQSERRFRRAVELAPGDPLWHYHFAQFLLLPLGRIDEALRELQVAEKLDPLLHTVDNALRWALKAAGRFDEADAHCRKKEINGQRESGCLAEALLREGKTAEAIQMLEARWNNHLLEPGAQALGAAYAKAGRREDAERVAAIVPRPESKAVVFAALGDKDRTFEALDRMIPVGPVRMGRYVFINPQFALLHGDPRWDALRRKAGLPE